MQVAPNNIFDRKRSSAWIWRNNKSTGNQQLHDLSNVYTGSCNWYEHSASMYGMYVLKEGRNYAR